METAVAFLLGIIVGVGVASVWRRGDKGDQGVDRKEGTKLSRALSAKKKENLAKITEYLADHETVTNDVKKVSGTFFSNVQVFDIVRREF
jgi:hypothetical protein